MKSLLEEVDTLHHQILVCRPFEGDLLTEVKEYFRIGLTYSSNSIEGNSLTESETKVVIEDGLTIGGKPLRDHLEASGHSDAYDFIYSLLDTETLSENDIKEIHRLFYHRIASNEAGSYRAKKVILTGSKYPLPNPDELPTLMSSFTNNLRSKWNTLHAIEKAAQIHKHFVFIHPFVDGNGRVARLLMNLSLLREQYLPVIIPPLRRAEYISALEEAHEDDSTFLSFIAEMAIETYRDFGRIIAP